MGVERRRIHRRARCGHDEGDDVLQLEEALADANRAIHELKAGGIRGAKVLQVAGS